jgi:hypothetical protein
MLTNPAVSDPFLIRRLVNQPPPDVFVLASIEGLRLLIWAFEHIDGSNLHANLIGLQPSDSSFHKPGNHWLRHFRTEHTDDSQWYVVLERRYKLKPEYSSLNSIEIGHLKPEGVAVTDPVDLPIVALTGDTTTD